MKEKVSKLTYPTLPNYLIKIHKMNGKVCILKTQNNLMRSKTPNELSAFRKYAHLFLCKKKIKI